MARQISSPTCLMLVIALGSAIGTVAAAGYVYGFDGDPQIVVVGAICTVIAALFAFVSWVMTPPTLERIRPFKWDGKDDGPTIH